MNEQQNILTNKMVYCRGNLKVNCKVYMGVESGSSTESQKFGKREMLATVLTGSLVSFAPTAEAQDFDVEQIGGGLERVVVTGVSAEDYEKHYDKFQVQIALLQELAYWVNKEGVKQKQIQTSEQIDVLSQKLSVLKANIESVNLMLLGSAALAGREVDQVMQDIGSQFLNAAATIKALEETLEDLKSEL